MRTFLLHRNEDVSGQSGTGIVAEGAQLASGKVILSWLRDPHAIGIYESLDAMKTVHAHGQKTVVLWTG